ncbi:hypothetical protein U1Q18_014450 [Sarracenia purpurea var. burkii]
MEEELSIASIAITTLTKETSDSDSNSYPLHRNKRPRHDLNIPPLRFKGVVSQHNGHWGAQIYANHQRIWLGTFKSERDAAMAYDSASIKLRSRDTYRNFPWTNFTFQEPNFQSHFSTEAVLNMIKDGSYPSKFSDFLRFQFQMLGKDSRSSLVPNDSRGFSWRQLFQKELTPSDVGKLNRLVIPKKYALRYFPHGFEDAKENLASGGVEDVQLVFYDRLMRSWKFRYCYWKSSQSFVFTRGWNRFVKENELKEKDVVIFNVCEHREGSNHTRSFCMIDLAYKGQVGNKTSGVDSEEDAIGDHLGQNVRGVNNEKELEEERETTAVESTEEGKKSFRLFGVQIY